MSVFTYTVYTLAHAHAYFPRKNINEMMTKHEEENEEEGGEQKKQGIEMACKNGQECINTMPSYCYCCVYTIMGLKHSVCAIGWLHVIFETKTD